jgi:hypothetical protein
MPARLTHAHHGLPGLHAQQHGATGDNGFVVKR